MDLVMGWSWGALGPVLQWNQGALGLVMRWSYCRNGAGRPAAGDGG